MRNPREAVAKHLVRAAIVVAALALPSLSAAVPPASKTLDKVGDAGGAPDISEVVVSSNATSVSFKLTFADRESLQPDERVVLVLDADQSMVTGDKYGTDMRISYREIDEQNFGWGLSRWDGTGWELSPTRAKVRFVQGPSTLRIVLDREELYGSWGLTWFVLALPAGASGVDDHVPDSRPGSYSLRSGMRPDPPGRDRGTIRSIFSSFTPRLALLDGVKPGAILELEYLFVKLPSGERVEARDTRCVAGIGGRALVPVRPCAWRVPANAQGKTVLVDIGVVYRGLSESGFISQFRVS